MLRFRKIDFQHIGVKRAFNTSWIFNFRSVFNAGWFPGQMIMRLVALWFCLICLIWVDQPGQ